MQWYMMWNVHEYLIGFLKNKISEILQFYKLHQQKWYYKVFNGFSEGKILVM